MKVIINPATGSAAVTLSIDSGVTMTVSAGKLAGAETVTFQLIEDGVGSYGDLYQNAELQQLTATHNAITIPGPIDIQVTKSATTLAVGVYAKG